MTHWHLTPHLLLRSIPDLGQAETLAATVAVALLCVGLGRLVGARRPPGALIAGWGVVVLTLVGLGTLTPLPLSWGLGLLAVPALAGLCRAAAGGIAPAHWAATGRVLILATPLWLVFSTIAPSQFDEFSHWLPNFGYLYLFDHLPTRVAPDLVSYRPGYPTGQAFIDVAVSMIARHLCESAGIVWNGLLLLAGAATFANLLAARLADATERPQPAAAGWAVAAAGQAAATLFNPIFVPKLVFTNYGDWAVGSVLAILTGDVLVSLDADQRDRLAPGAALAGGFGAAALVDIRQDSFGLFAIFCVGVAIACLRDWRAGGRPVSIAAAAAFLLPPLATALLWRHYVATQIPAGTFEVLSPGHWRWPMLPGILAQIATIALNKAGYFALLAAVALVAIAAILSPTRFTAVQRRGLILAATVGLGQIALIVTAYLVANFSDAEALRAESFWRFNSHSGLAVMLAAVLLVPTGWLRGRRPISVALIVIVVSTPVLVLPWLKFDIDAHTPYQRMIGDQLVALTRGAASVTLLDTSAAGEANVMPIRYQVLVADRQEMAHPAPTFAMIVSPTPRYFTVAGEMPRYAAAGQANEKMIAAAMAARFVWVYQGDAVASALVGQPLDPDFSYLLERRPEGLRIIRRWALPHWSAKDA